MDATSPDRADLQWTRDLGLSSQEQAALNPCVPGEFTLSATYYINTATPRLVYAGTAEGSLPLVAGRWYLIPDEIVARHPNLTRDAVPVARAARLARP